MSSTSGLRRRSVRFTSSITAPDSEVTTATRVQNTGMRRLRASSHRPSSRSFSASAATCWRSSPSPANVNDLATKLMRPVALYRLKLPVNWTCMPSRSSKLRLAYDPRQMMQSTAQASSLIWK